MSSTEHYLFLVTLPVYEFEDLSGIAATTIATIWDTTLNTRCGFG